MFIAASMVRVQMLFVIFLFEKVPPVPQRDEQALTCPTQFHFGKLNLLNMSPLFSA